jgi:hypothetical protein
MNRNIIFLYLIIFIPLTTFAQDKQDWSAARPDGHAPISVMGDHMHNKGEIMFSYKNMPMWMKGSLQGSDALADNVILQNYMAAPQDMQMKMHMLGSMYAPSNRVTLMVMVNYISNTMGTKDKNGHGLYNPIKWIWRYYTSCTRQFIQSSAAIHTRYCRCLDSNWKY